MKSVDGVLAVLDKCCDEFTFPMLDNGYVYLAAARLTAYCSSGDWALVIEVFGFSPRAGSPDVQVYTFASRLHDRRSAQHYVDEEAHQRYLRNNPNNELRFFQVFEDDTWQNAENLELVEDGIDSIVLRGEVVTLPSTESYESMGIDLEEPPRVHVFELCRSLASSHRDQVLATSAERRASVPPELTEVMRLDEWQHPDVVAGERPSVVQCFREIAKVLVTGDASHYGGSYKPNTHWENWPEGGRL